MMITRPLPALLLLVSAALPAAAWEAPALPKAQEADVEAIRSCLAENEEPATCLGQVSDPCQEEPGGASTIGIGECLARETAVWDLILNENYEAAREQAHETDERLGENRIEGAEETLLAAQRAWITWRDAECSRLYALNQQGTIRSIVYASCRRDLTADRALDLAPQAN